MSQEPTIHRRPNPVENLFRRGARLELLLGSMRRVIRIRPQLWLGLVVAVTLAMATRKPLQEFEMLDAQPPPGPLCLLKAAPPLDAPRDLWRLPGSSRVLPIDLLAAGYPEPASHRVVARVTCTAYTASISETDSTPDITASNKVLRPGYIALSRDLLATFTPGAPFDFGDRVELIGVGVFQVEDTMHPRWRRRADIWVLNREVARAWGRRTLLIGKRDEPRGAGHEDMALLGWDALHQL